MDSRLVATTLLTRVVDDGRNLDALCDREHGLKAFQKLSVKDQALARAISVTALRNRTRIEASLKRMMNRPPPKNARFLIHTLHVAAAQILYMDVPNSAAVNIAVNAIKNDKRTIRFSSLANAVLRRMSREAEKLRSQTDSVSPFPDWFAKMLRTDYGKANAIRIAESVGHSPALDVSVKSDSSAWAERLEGNVLPTGSIRVNSSKPVHELPGYDEGEWWVQDAAAALPAKLVTAPTGSDVLELCAAPGGKTAQLVSAGYVVTAVDSSKPRLNRLKDNLSRLRMKAEIVCADILEWELEKKFDAVLIDAPCSSTGTIRRHPDVLWAKSADDIPALAALQFDMLKRASGFVKPGGMLVFANCSMLKSEGEDLLAKAMEALPDFTLSKITPDEVSGIDGFINGQGALRSLPCLSVKGENGSPVGLDGFFACRFIRPL